MDIQRPIYLKKLQEKKDNGLVKVITGLRRVGKTYLLKILYRNWLLTQGIPAENILYLPLDKNENMKLRNPIELDHYLREQIGSSEKRFYIIIDEIQYSVNVPNPYLPQEVQNSENEITFYDTVLGLMDQCDLYITGSNSEMLSSDILTNFRGRGDEIRVFPLNYREYVSAVAGDSDVVWMDYLRYGGMPLILAQADDEEKAHYLSNLFESTYLKDIVERYHIKNEDDLSRLMDLLASTTGSLVNPTNISNQFPEHSVSRNTVAEYIHYINNSFLIEEAARFDIRGKEYIQGQQKYYFTDLGLRNARLNFRQFDLPHLLENVVYNELKNRGCSVDVGRVQVRVRNASGNYQISYLESDFVVNNADHKAYIQVAEGLDEPGKKEQEMKSLLHIRDGFPKIILVNQMIPAYYSEEGIRIMSIRKFLLAEKWDF